MFSIKQRQVFKTKICDETGLLRDLSGIVGDYCDWNEHIYLNRYAFVAKLADETIVTWGDSSYGGDSSDVQAYLKQVETIYSTNYAFAAKLADGSVVTWGDPNYGADSRSVQSELKQVETIYSTCGAFAAKLADGRVVTWGRF